MRAIENSIEKQQKFCVNKAYAACCVIRMYWKYCWTNTNP